MICFSAFMVVLFTVPGWLCKESEPSPEQKQLSDSLHLVDSIWLDSVGRADSAVNDSIDRGLIRVIDGPPTDNPDPTPDGRWY